MADFLSSVWDSARCACRRGYDKPRRQGLSMHGTTFSTSNEIWLFSCLKTRKNVFRSFCVLHFERQQAAGELEEGKTRLE